MSDNNKQQLNIGLFGFGVVGESLYQVLQEHPTFQADISRICIRHVHKKRNAPAKLFTTSHLELLNDDSINVIIELIDDADAAFLIVREALTRGKAVISANKKMIAEHLPELLELQRRYKAPFLYEAACCASIPVIRNLEEYYDNDLLRGLQGIINGATNYILTRIAEDGADFHSALKGAQALGFAESDPHLDVSGKDARNKLSILLAHAYGIVAAPEELLCHGITQLEEEDARYAEAQSCKIKLVAQARKLEDGTVAAFVLPRFVPADSQLHNVNNEYNGIVMESGLAEVQFFYGKGAGGSPTASAVLSDLSALRYNYRYEYKKLYNQEPARLAADVLLRVYVSVDDINRIPQRHFEEITKWSSSGGRFSVTGIIRLSVLKKAGWWRRKGVSLIAGADAIAGSVAQKAKRQYSGITTPV